MLGGGTVVVNGGTYAETIALNEAKTLIVTGPNVAQTVAINDLAAIAGTTIDIQGSSSLTLGAGNAPTGTIAGQVTGSGSLTKTGSGTLTLGGPVANTFAGGTTIDGGVIDVGQAGAFGSGTLTINAAGTVITGSAFNLQAANRPDIGSNTNLIVNSDAAFANNMTIPGANNTNGLSIGGSGTLTYTGDVGYTGMFSLNDSATLKLGPGGSITLGNSGNSLMWMNDTSTLILDGGAFSSLGWNGPNAAYLGNLIMNSGTASIGGGGTSAQVILRANAAVTLNGGTLSVQGFSGGASNTVNFNGGTLRALASNANFLPAPIVATVQAGGAVVDTNALNPTIATVLAARRRAGRHA